MSEVAVERGEIGLERLRIAFAERAGKGTGLDSAFADLLQTRVEDSTRTATSVKAEDRAASSSAFVEDSSGADETKEESGRDEEKDDDARAEESRQVSAGEVAGDVPPVATDEKQWVTVAKTGSAQSETASADRTGARSDGERDASSGESLPEVDDAAKARARPGSEIENAIAEKQSTAQGEIDPAVGDKPEKKESDGKKASELEPATEIAMTEPSEVPVIAGDLPDGKKIEGEDANKTATNRKTQAGEKEEAKAAVTQIGEAKEAIRAAADAGANPLAAPSARGTEGDDTSVIERGRSKGKRHFQKGDVGGDEKINRFQPTGGLQETPRGIPDRPIAAQNLAPAPAENAGPSVAATPTGTAVAASESNAAANAPPVVGGAASTRTDSGGTASGTPSATPGRTGEQSQPNLDAADRARFVQRVSQAFRAANERGGHVRLRLHPPELGSLRVELKITDGVMSARMEAESAAARDLLAEHLPVLRQRLADHGIRVERFELDLMGRDGQGPSQQAFQSPTDGQGRRHHEMTPSRRRAQAIESAGRPEGIAVGVRSASGIDVMI
ncbi:flagellar hook-length control protein FliK [Thermopirellula anaerolimosa]